MGDREQLAQLSQERITCPPEFAPSQEVWRVAGMVSLRPATWLCCPLCRRGIVQTTWDGQMILYGDEERRSLVLAHMIQSHQWTREVVGDC